MTVEFQLELLKYLFQNSDAKRYITYLDETVFDSGTHQVLFKLWKDYIKLYKYVPSKSHLIEFFEREWENTRSAKATSDLKKIILNDIALIYSPLSGDTVFIKEIIIDFAQKKLTKRLFIKNADKIPNGSDKFFQALAKEMHKIVALRNEDTQKEENRGHYYIAQANEVQLVAKPVAKVQPTPWWSLNRMTAAGGFYAPQLIVLLKGAKAYGTGILIKMALYDMMLGEKVFYVDMENSKEEIYLRMDMAMLGCEMHEVKGLQRELKWIKAQIALRGGEFKVQYFDAGLATLDDLDAELTRLAEEEDFKPTKYYSDYLDKFAPTDKSIKETRLKTRNLYEHQVRLNNKYKFPCITISPITGDSDRAYYTMRDFGEDKHKAYNCHGSFALNCTPAESKAGTMRISPVLQRQGTANMFNAETTCALEVDRKRGIVTELDSETYLALMDIEEEPVEGKKKGRLVSLDKLPIDLTDE